MSNEIIMKQEKDWPLSFWQYMPHQQDAIKRFTQKCTDKDGNLKEKHGILLIHSMGSGKTLTSLGMALNLNNPVLKGRKKWVIITPPGLDSAFRGDMNDIGFSDEDIEKMELPEKLSAIELVTIDGEISELEEKLNSLEEGREWNELQELTEKISDSAKISEQEMKNLVKFVELTKKRDEYKNEIEKLKETQGELEKKYREIPAYPELKFWNFDHMKLFNESDLEDFYNSLKDATVICDEAHNLVTILKTFVRQDKKLNYTRILDGFNAAFKVILLSGTPLQQEWSDLTLLTSICAGYVNDQKHAKFPTYDKKLNIMYPPPVTHASWIRKRLLDPNINALGYAAGVSAVFYAALTAGICIAPAALIGMASTFKMAKSLTSGVLTTVEAITSTQKGEVNVFNMEKLILDLQNYISFFDYTQLQYHLTPSFPMPPTDPDNKTYKKVPFSHFQTDLYLKQGRIEDILDNLDLEFVGRKSSGADAFKLEESRLINLSDDELTSRLRVVGNLSEDNHFFNTAREFNWETFMGGVALENLKKNPEETNILDFNKVFYAFPRYDFEKMMEDRKKKVNISDFKDDKNNDKYLNDVSDPLSIGIGGWVKNEDYLKYMKKYRTYLNSLHDSYKNKSEMKGEIIEKHVKRTALRDHFVSEEWEIVHRKVPIKQNEYEVMKKIFQEKNMPSYKFNGEVYYKNKITGETKNEIPESFMQNIHDKMEKKTNIPAGERYNILLHVKKGNKIKITFDAQNSGNVGFTIAGKSTSLARLKTQDIAFNLFNVNTNHSDGKNGRMTYGDDYFSAKRLSELVKEYYDPKWKHVQMGSIPYIHQSIDGCNLDDVKNDKYKCDNLSGNSTTLTSAIKDFRNKRTKVLMKYKDKKYKKYEDYFGPLSHIDKGIYNDNGTIKSTVGGIPAYCDVVEYLMQQDATYEGKCYQPKSWNWSYWGTNLRYSQRTTKEFIPDKDGTILISFDNSYSAATSKNVEYIIEGDYSFVKGDKVSMKKNEWAQFYEGEIIKVNREPSGEDTYDIKFKGPIHKIFNENRNLNPMKTLGKFEEIKDINSLSPRTGKIFLANKFIYAFNEIMKFRQTNHYLPVFYSNFEEFGFNTFSAMLTSMGYYHIVIHPDDPAIVRKKLIQYANLPYRKFVPCGKDKDEKKNNIRLMKYRPQTYDEEEADSPGIVKRLNLNRYKNLTSKNKNLKKNMNVPGCSQKKSQCVTIDLDDDSLVPVCIVLHPKIVEGLSFNLSPMILVNESIKGYGRAEQLYARIIRAIRGNSTYDFNNNKNDNEVISTIEKVIKDNLSKKKDIETKKEIPWMRLLQQGNRSSNNINQKFLIENKINNDFTKQYLKVYMELIKKQKELIISLEECKNGNTCDNIKNIKRNGFFNKNKNEGFFEFKKTAQAAGAEQYRLEPELTGLKNNSTGVKNMLKYFDIDFDNNITTTELDVSDMKINTIKKNILDTISKKIPSLVDKDIDFGWTRFVKDIPTEYKNLMLSFNNIKKEDIILDLKVKQNNNFQYHIFLIKQIKLLQVVSYILKVLIFNHNFVYNIEKLDLSTIFFFINEDKDEDLKKVLNNSAKGIEDDKYVTSYKILNKIVKSDQFRKIPLSILLSEINNINKKFIKLEETAPKTITECISEGKLPFDSSNLDTIERARYYMSANENKPWFYPDYTVEPNVLFKMNDDIKKYIENYKKNGTNKEIKFKFKNGKIGHVNSKDLLNCQKKNSGDLCRASVYLVDRDQDGNSIKSHKRCSKQVIILQNSFHQMNIMTASFIRGLGRVLNVPSLDKASAVDQPMPICMDLVNWYMIDPIKSKLGSKEETNIEQAIMHDIDGEQTSYTGQYLGRLMGDDSYPSNWNNVSPTEATNTLSNQLSPDEIIETSNRVIMFNWLALVKEIQKKNDLEIMANECADNEKKKCKIWLQEKIGDSDDKFNKKSPGNCMDENYKLDDLQENQYKILAYSDKVNESWANHYAKLLTLKNQLLQSQLNIEYLQTKMVGINDFTGQANVMSGAMVTGASALSYLGWLSFNPMIGIAVGAGAGLMLELIDNYKGLPLNGSYRIKLSEDINILKILSDKNKIYSRTKLPKDSKILVSNQQGKKSKEYKHIPCTQISSKQIEQTIEGPAKTIKSENNQCVEEVTYEAQFNYYKEKYPLLNEIKGISFKKGDVLEVINFHPEENFEYSQKGLGKHLGAKFVNSTVHLWKYITHKASKYSGNYSVEKYFKLPNHTTPPSGYGSHWLAVRLIEREKVDVNELPVWETYSIIPAKKEGKKYFRSHKGPLKNGRYEIDEEYELRNELLNRFNKMNTEYESKYENTLDVIMVPPVKTSMRGDLNSMVKSVMNIGGYIGGHNVKLVGNTLKKIKNTVMGKKDDDNNDNSDLVGEGSLADNMEDFYRELLKEAKSERENNQKLKLELRKEGDSLSGGSSNYNYKYITHPITGNSYHLNSAQGMLILNRYKNIMNRK